MSEGLFRDKSKHPKQKLFLTLPMGCSINHMYVRLRGGGQRLTKEAEQWVNTVKTICKREITAQKWLVEPNSVWYVLELHFYFPDKRKRDSHNYIKLLMDALEHDAYFNDYYVKPRIMSVDLDKEKPRIECFLYMDK